MLLSFRVATCLPVAVAVFINGLPAYAKTAAGVSAPPTASQPGIPAVVVPDLSDTSDAAFTTVDIDTFLQHNVPPMRNSRMIVPLKGVRFEATITAAPEPRQISYLYSAMSVMGVKNAPQVSHRLVLASPSRKPFAVYVTDELLPSLRSARPDQRGRFTGFHVYNYAKGPAILVTGFEPR